MTISKWLANYSKMHTGIRNYYEKMESLLLCVFQLNLNCNS